MPHMDPIQRSVQFDFLYKGACCIIGQAFCQQCSDSVCCSVVKKNRTNLRLHTRRTVSAGALPCCNIRCCDCCASRISIKLLIVHTPTVHVFLHSFCCSYLKWGSRSFFLVVTSISDFLGFVVFSTRSRKSSTPEMRLQEGLY